MRGKPFYHVSVLLVAVALSSGPPGAWAAEPAGTSYGSGFPVSVNGGVVTAAHLVQRCRRLVAQTIGGAILEAQLVRSDTASDLALLQLRSARALPVLSLRRDPTPILGEPVATLGFPFLDELAARPTFETGIVNGLAGLRGDPADFRISIPLDGGFSGAPIVDRSGLVIGMVRGYAAHGRPGEAMQPANINLAVSGVRLAEFLRSTQTARTAGEVGAVTTAQTAGLLARAILLIRCLN